MLYSHIRQYICKNTKNIQKSDFMDGFCWQGELDLTQLAAYMRITL